MYTCIGFWVWIESLEGSCMLFTCLPSINASSQNYMQSLSDISWDHGCLPAVGLICQYSLCRSNACGEWKTLIYNWNWICTCSATWRSPWNHLWWQLKMWMVIVIMVKVIIVLKGHRVGRNVENFMSKAQRPKGRAKTFLLTMNHDIYGLDNNSGCNGWRHPVWY